MGGRLAVRLLLLLALAGAGGCKHWDAVRLGDGPDPRHLHMPFNGI